MEDTIKQYLATLLRNLATPLIVWLAATGWITENQATAFFVALIPIVISVVWGLANKYIFHRQIETALKMPAGSSKAQLKAIEKL